METTSQSKTHYANLWDRFVISFVDSLILSAFAIVLTIITSILVIAGINETTASIIYFVLYVTGSITYYTVLDANGKQTLGKKATSYQVFDLEGKPISTKKSLFRLVISLLVSPVSIATPFTILFTKKKQSLFDMITGTTVVKVKK